MVHGAILSCRVGSVAARAGLVERINNLVPETTVECVASDHTAVVQAG